MGRYHDDSGCARPLRQRPPTPAGRNVRCQGSPGGASGTVRPRETKGTRGPARRYGSGQGGAPAPRTHSSDMAHRRSADRSVRRSPAARGRLERCRGRNGAPNSARARQTRSAFSGVLSIQRSRSPVARGTPWTAMACAPTTRKRASTRISVARRSRKSSFKALTLDRDGREERFAPSSGLAGTAAGGSRSRSRPGG